jgi:hypothetical protein
MDKVLLLNRKMFIAALGIAKINIAVGFGASVVFFVIILVSSD